MKVPKPTDADRERFAALVPRGDGVEVKPMFGNLGAFVNGNMFMGLFGGDVGVKLAEADRERLLAEPGAGPFGPAERPMGGYVTLPADWSARKAKRWTDAALATAGLPAKKQKSHTRAPDPKPVPRHELERGHERRSAPPVTVDVLTDTVIDRPVAEVSAYAGDPTNAPEWYANIDSATWKTSPPAVQVGAEVAFVARFLGRRLEYTYELAEVVPGERLVMRTAQGPFPMETTYTWSAAGGASTRMTLRNRGEQAGFSKVVAPLMAPAMRRANRKDLAALKSLLERRP